MALTNDVHVMARVRLYGKMHLHLLVMYKSRMERRFVALVTARLIGHAFKHCVDCIVVFFGEALLDSPCFIAFHINAIELHYATAKYITFAKTCLFSLKVLNF